MDIGYVFFSDWHSIALVLASFLYLKQGQEKTMQFGDDFHSKKCARCGRVIESDPAFEDALWFHRVCLEKGKQELRRANEIAVRFGVPPIPAGDVATF